LIVDAGIKRTDSRGKRRIRRCQGQGGHEERPDSPWAEEIVRGMIVRGMETTESFRLIPLTNIPLTLPQGATKRAHLGILAESAETVQPMVGGFF
jgi:hypothetical protein